jgi:ABC-type oligopeptide transport system substrate-binding subunit
MNNPTKLRSSQFVIAVIVSFAVLGYACGKNDNSTGLSKTFVRGINSDPESLDPHKFLSVQAGDILRDIGEGLVAYGPQGELVPGIATDWTVSEDGLLYIFNLRPNAKWSNGEPLTAADFVNSYRRLFDLQTASPSASYSDMILSAPKILRGEASPDALGVSASGSHMLEIRLSNPTPYFLQILTNPSMFPVYNSATKDRDRDSASVVTVSNGAYSLEERLVGSLIKLGRNEHYWDNENTWFDEVLYRTLDPQAEMLGFRAGEIDFTNSVATGSFEKMKLDSPAQLKVSPSLNVYYYGFNLTRPPFKGNPKLRQALSMALDRKSLVEKVTRRGELPAYSFVPDGIAGYVPHELPYSSMAPKERILEAKRLYSEAGYGPQNQAHFQLRYNTKGDHQLIALAIQSLWSEHLGAKVELLNEEFRSLISKIQEMQVTQAFRLSWAGDYKDPLTFLQLFQTDNPNNLTGYNNPEFDNLLARARQEVDPDTRFALLRDAEGIALADHPIIPIYFFVNKHMLASDIVGYYPSLLDVHYSKDFERVRSTDQ